MPVKKEESEKSKPEEMEIDQELLAKEFSEKWLSQEEKTEFDEFGMEGRRCYRDLEETERSKIQQVSYSDGSLVQRMRGKGG